MQQLSDNNFDGLFKKAAENYPLKTDNKNWDAVASKLHSNLSSSTVKSNKKWKYALLLMLLSGSAIFTYKFYNNSKGINNNSHNALSYLSKTKNAGLQYKRTITGSINQNKNNTLQSKITTSFKKILEQKKSVEKSISALNNKPAIGNSFYIQNNILMQTTALQKESNMNFQSPKISNTNEVTVNKADVVKNNNQSSVDIVAQNNDQNKKINSIESIKSQHIKVRPQPKTFYGEFYFAPDFSTVKSQKVNSPGYKVGVALGYRLSKHFSAELGLERLHTDFFTDAKYLDKSSLKYKPNTNLQEVNGKSKLTEVPLSIKYNFSKSDEHFFVTAGTALVRITHSENYNYYIKKNGEPREISKRFGALTATKFLSEVNFSAGYQTSISGVFHLKIQPYYQIPLKSLGVGNLPVTNFGINVGIIKDLK